jgi:hypothetical protein
VSSFSEAVTKDPEASVAASEIKQIAAPYTISTPAGSFVTEYVTVA